MRVLIFFVFLLTLNAFSKSFNSTVCPDKSTCSNDETCCPIDIGYGCCPIENAVCCSDTKHCCPHNTRCNIEASTCDEKVVKKEQFPSNGPCGSSTAIICDGFCCPEGNRCLNSSKKCVKPSFEAFMIPMMDSLSLDIFSFESHKCPNPNYSCADDSTCCSLGGSSYGCCPYKKATCCQDNKSCCPENYSCNVEERVCIPEAALSDGIVVTKNDKLQKIKAANNDQINSEDIYQRVIDSLKGRSSFDEEMREENAIVLADPLENVNNRCQTDETKCADNRGHVNCCPFKNGVCCPDGRHCCRKGYTCDSIKKRCVRDNYSDDIRAYGHPNLYPLTTAQRNIAGSMVTCDDGKTKCKGMCCKNKDDVYKCCRFKDGVCCADGIHCCPKGSTCDPKRGRCGHKRNNFFQLFNIYDVKNNYYYMPSQQNRPNFNDPIEKYGYTMTKPTSRRVLVPREFCQGQSCGDNQKCCHNLTSSRLECCDM